MEEKNQKNQQAKEFLNKEYGFGFVSDIEQDIAKKGLNEETIKFISSKKNEPEWLLKWRLKAYKNWLKKPLPRWVDVEYNEPDFQAISYYAEPKKKPELNSLDELDPEIRRTFGKLGIPLDEQKRLANVAVDAVLDSVSIATTFKDKLKEMGIIFCSIGGAVKDHPEIVKKYLGTVVPFNDNFFANLNSAVFSDGSFVYIPPNTRCPMELSTYFRINAEETGQFERTLIIADKNSYVSYLEGCTAPTRSSHQLHSAVVELVALENAEIRYSTVQNWYPGDKSGKGGVYNFVTKRGRCEGKNSKISWTQVETGSAITWKYPSCILKGEGSVGEFFSIAVTNNSQQADTGSKMTHIGKNTKSRIISKSILAGESVNNYRGMVKITSGAKGAKNYTSCDSLLLSDKAKTSTFPKVETHNKNCSIEHEATTSKINDEILFYCQQRGVSSEEATNLVINGFTKEVVKKLPLEFALEAQKLLEITLEDTVG
jgi:Fe-S cluster assembly protein SufB